MLILSFFFVATVNAVTFTLSKTTGHVYDQINISGEVPANYTWHVYFDINCNGTFETGEHIASGNPGATTTLASYFVVPPCNGSDGDGVVHMVYFFTDYRDTILYFLLAAAAPYDEPYFARSNFTVTTQRSFSLPTSVKAGVSIPIQLNINGGRSNTQYNYRVDVTRPDGSSSTATFSTTTDRLGTASGSIAYPTNFPAGQSSSQIGNYSITVRELSPMDSYQYSQSVQVYDTITPTPTNSTPIDGGGNSGITDSPTPTPDNSTPSGPTNNTVTSTPTPTATSLITPTPTPSAHTDDGTSNGTSNQAPTARLITTPPAKINQGQSVIISADANDVDGNIANYLWTSDISGVISTSNQLNTASLPSGLHHISFYAIDNDGAASNTVLLELTVNSESGFDPLPIVGVASAGTAVAVSAGAAVWVHYDHLNSVKIKNKLSKKTAEQKQQEENQKKKDEKRNKKRANLVFSDFKVPTNIMKDTSYTAQFKVTNLGSAKATNIRVNTLANRFFGVKDATVPVRDLSPGEHETVNIPFTTNPEIRKNLYQLQFEVKSKQTPAKVKRCFMRGGRIAVLTDAEVPSVAEPVLSWLKTNSYPFEELHDAAHLMTQLYQYDLLIVSANHDMPSKWVQNLCTFVENGQSILLIDKISTRSPERLTEALGYVEEPNAVSIPQAALEICHSHPITTGLSLGETIPLGPCIENTVKFTQTPAPATIIANNVNQQSNLGPSSPVAAVMVKQDGKGKIVHLNFHAQEHLNQIDRLIKNSVDWLLWD